MKNKTIWSKRFKKLKEIQKDTNSDTIEKLIPIVKKNCTTKFDEAIDLIEKKMEKMGKKKKKTSKK